MLFRLDRMLNRDLSLLRSFIVLRVVGTINIPLLRSQTSAATNTGDESPASEKRRQVGALQKLFIDFDLARHLIFSRSHDN